MFSDFFIRIYILPYHQLFGICLCGLLLFWELRRRFDGRWWWRWMIGTALILWAAVVVYYTVMGRDSGTGAQWSMIPLHSYREVLNGGNPEILRSNLMNVVLFIPGGLLWNVLSQRKSVIATLLIFGLFSLSIEVWQYFFQLGNAECDDVIHNALGSVAGSYMASINRYVLLPQAQLHQNILESEKSRR